MDRCGVGSVMIEDKKPVKVEKTEIVDETDGVRHGYVRKTRSRTWTDKGRLLSTLIYNNSNHRSTALF